MCITCSECWQFKYVWDILIKPFICLFLLLFLASLFSSFLSPCTFFFTFYIMLHLMLYEKKWNSCFFFFSKRSTFSAFSISNPGNRYWPLKSTRKWRNTGSNEWQKNDEKKQETEQRGHQMELIMLPVYNKRNCLGWCCTEHTHADVDTMKNIIFFSFPVKMNSS